MNQGKQMKMNVHEEAAFKALHRAYFLNESTYNNVVEGFLRFHGNNPHVLDELIKRAEQKMKDGYPHYDLKTIIGEMRWDQFKETKRIGIKSTDKVTINNNHVAWYARLMVALFPEFGDFFELRSVKGQRS